ncbi:CLUMA_CG015401, isoform A [Clunio marinus]|uniref:CLUMA_CG015401, isoform A n=1 Tax=Clunio marinus TaxID=568069 RepID=A0A1J1IRN5_9DIPT|nr:CLUMA_CG015401, isoform A [Clunio marinus]
MDKRENIGSSDDENFEDANEKIVNELIEEATGVKLTGVNDEYNMSLNEEDDSDHEINEKDSFVDCETSDFIDDESQKEMEKDQTKEEQETAKLKAEELKKQGNEVFKTGDYVKSTEIYTNALRTCPVACEMERSIIYGNRAAAKQKLNLKPAAIDDCTKSLEFNPNYVKVLLRRAALYEETEKLDESLEDNKKILELDPGNHDARAALVRLPPMINERNEKMKAEMIDKLKDLGNMILRPFGLSTRNFELKQDPSSGSYSVNFNQSPQ